MPYPTFSKTGLTTLTFSRGALFPQRRPTHYRQRRGVSEAGTVRVATLSPPVQELVLHFERLPAADFALLDAWLAAALVNGSAQTFTYTDSTSTAYTVRWWPSDAESTFDMVQVAAGLYNVDLPLRVEL